MIKTILAIDDQQDNLTTFKAVIKTNVPNCKVLTALSGEEGIKIAKKENPDTILLDIIMPEMDGYETCRRLKADGSTKNIPIIMITAVKTDSKSRVKGLNMGADAFLSKPIDAIELSAQINVMLRIKEAEDRLRGEKDILSIKVKESTVELTRSEEKFRSIFNSAGDGILYVDNNAKILDVNPAFSEISGISRKDLAGKTAFSVAKKFLNIKQLPNVINIITKTIAGKSINNFILFFNNKYLEIFSTRSIESGYFIGIIRDITNRVLAEETLKDSEENNRLLIENAPYCIHQIDNQSNLISMNPVGLDMMGVKDEQEIIGMRYLDTVSNEDKKRIGILLHDALNGIPCMFEFTATSNRRFASSFVPIIKDNKVMRLMGLTQDITERKKNEDKLRSSEERLKILFESAPDAYYIHDFKGIFQDVNKEAEKLLGYKKDELIGRSLLNLQLLIGKEMLRATEVLMQNVKGKSTGPDEFIMNRKNGSRVHVEITTHPVKIKDRRVVLGIARDITKRKQAEETLLKLSTAVQQSPSVIAITDLNGIFDYVNPKFTSLTGYTSKEALGNKTSILKSGGQNDAFYKELWEKVSSGKEWRGEFHNKKKNGELFWEAASVSPIIDKEGNITNYVKVAEDITERKKSEQIQKVLFNISSAVNTTENLEKLIGKIQTELGRIVDTNNFYVALYDRNSDTFSFPYYNDEKDHFTTAPAAKTLSKYIIETKKPLLANLALMKKFVKEGKLIYQGSLSKVWLGVPLKIGNKVTGVFALQSYKTENAFNDSDKKMLEYVSDQISLSIHRKKAEDNLKEALHKAEESDRLKSAFLANMSHEIRTPMNGILGFTSLLHTPNLTTEQLNKYTGIIEKSGERLLNIINDLLDISKIEAEQMDVTISECNVNEQIDFLFTFFKPEANSAGLEFYFNTGLKRTESIIETDREKLYAILTNLIKNAIKYTQKGSIEFGYEKKQKELEFYVKDTGIGIYKARQQAIFERFVQADIEDIEVYEGAGLGLSITKAYVEMLGGKIWLDSAEGEGSTFYFTLPYSLSKKDVSSSLSELKEPTEALSEKIKLLIAEDDELADEFLTIITEELSSSLLHAKNGKETIDICHQHPDIDLILMDIKMPVMDGLEATRKIREFNTDVIIIAQTAFALAGDSEKALAAGCDDYITKPIDKDELIKMMSKHIK